LGSKEFLARKFPGLAIPNKPVSKDEEIELELDDFLDSDENKNDNQLQKDPEEIKIENKKISDIKN